MPGKYFFIKSQFNGLVLDIENNSDDPGTAVIMWERKDHEPDNQLWYDDFDTLTIRSKKNDLCLTVKDGELTIDEYEDDNEDQKWMFLRGRGIIRNGEERDSVLDIADCSTEEGARIIAWEENGGDNQLWECERVDIRYFRIRSRMNGLVMGIKRNRDCEDAKVVMKDEEDGEDSQLWYEDGDNVIHSKLTGFVLQPKDDEEGEDMRMYEYEEGNEEQAWMRAGKHLIINRYQRDKALDIKDAEDDEGAPVIMWERHGEENQQFDFEYI